jgi:cytochrome c-type biogenesis protein CcmH/NrfF
MKLVSTFAVTRLRLLAALSLGVLLFLGAGDDSARVERLGHQMMCACGCNQILLECNHVGCTYSDRMRNELVAAVNAGTNDSNIMQSFIEKYGNTVLAAPTATGFDRIAWIMPYLALTLGVFGIVFVVRAWRSRRTLAPVPGVSVSRASDLDRFREQARRETEL